MLMLALCWQHKQSSQIVDYRSPEEVIFEAGVKLLVINLSVCDFLTGMVPGYSLYYDINLFIGKLILQRCSFYKISLPVYEHSKALLIKEEVFSKNNCLYVYSYPGATTEYRVTLVHTHKNDT